MPYYYTLESNTYETNRLCETLQEAQEMFLKHYDYMIAFDYTKHGMIAYCSRRTTRTTHDYIVEFYEYIPQVGDYTKLRNVEEYFTDAILLTDSQEIEQVLYHLGHKGEHDITAMIVSVGDGDYNSVYAYEGSYPYHITPIDYVTRLY